MDSIEPASHFKHVYHILEIACSLLKPCCQSAHIFHLTKEAFDNVTHGIKVFVVWDWFSCVWSRWNNCQRAFIFNLSPDFGTAIRLVCNNSQRFSLPIRESIKHLAIMHLTSWNNQSQRSAMLIYSRMNLVCAASAWAANTFCQFPLFDPAAARCAFTIEPSMKIKLSLTSFAKASKISFQTPLRPHLT